MPATSPTATSSTRGQFDARVFVNQPLCREHFKLILVVADFPPTRPGQFVQLACRDLSADYNPQTEIDWQPGTPLGLEGRELQSPVALLRRPFSLAGRRDTSGGVELDIIHRVVGIGTDWLARLAPGDAVGVLGPLGNSFTPGAADELALLVGGGVGIPPMIYFASTLAGQKAVVFSGALTRDLLPLTIDAGVTARPGQPALNVGEFSRHGIPAILTTDDGSFGMRGFVTQALEMYLDASSVPPSKTTIYTCGPEGMMKRVAQIAIDRGISCQIAVERAMACGMGTCQSCCIRVKKPDPALPPQAGKDWCYRLACTDGPVFQAKDLRW